MLHAEMDRCKSQRDSRRPFSTRRKSQGYGKPFVKTRVTRVVKDALSLSISLPGIYSMVYEVVKRAFLTLRGIGKGQSVRPRLIYDFGVTRHLFLAFDALTERVFIGFSFPCRMVCLKF